jgi:ABC-2 type transport system permease protein
MFAQIIAVALRVGQQLRRDRRFLGLSIAMPLVVIYMLYLMFEAVENPMFNPLELAVPAGAVLVHFLAYMLCTIALVRERTSGTLERMFVNGYRRVHIIGGYMLAYSVLGTLQSLIVLVMLEGLYDLNYAADTYIAAYLVMWLLATISIALGIFVSNFARNEGQVLPFIPLVILPSVFFSGLLVDVANLPGWAEYLSFITPMYYANETLSDIVGTGGSALLPALLTYGLVVLALATFTLREQEA